MKRKDMEEQPQTFDICIICALYEEAEAVINEFSRCCRIHFTQGFSSMDRYAYHYTTIQNKRGEPLTVLVTWLSGTGPTQTGLDLKPLLHEFRPRFAAMPGICAGDKRKVCLGDLVVAQYAYHYEEGKIIRESEGPSRHLPETKTVDPTSQVIQYARGFTKWKELVKEIEPPRLNSQRKMTREPQCVIAPMASGMAVRGDDLFLWLQEKYNRNTVALDMEAAAFYRALRALSHIHGLVVKGVCDYGDMSKNDVYHDYAARVSAVYLLSFVQEYITEQTMPRSNVEQPQNSANSPSIPSPPNLVPSRREEPSAPAFDPSTVGTKSGEAIPDHQSAGAQQHSQTVSFPRLQRLSGKTKFTLGLLLLLLIGTGLFSVFHVVSSSSQSSSSNPYDRQMQHLLLHDVLQANSQEAQWDEGGAITSSGKCQFAHQAYQLLALPQSEGLDCYAQAPKLNLTDFTYEANLTFLDGNSAGLVFRSQEGYPAKEYRFMIQTDGTYRLLRTTDGQQLTLQQGSSSAIHRDQTNVLAVVTDKSSIRLYANHQLLAQIHDDTYTEGHVGFYTPESPTDQNILAAQASDITIWSR